MIVASNPKDPPPVMPTRRPNVLLLMADQFRHDAMGCAGHPQVRTPNLDLLAASGVRFEQAVTPTPICMAARFSLLTGRRSVETRVAANAVLPIEGQDASGDRSLPVWPTLMTTLADAGYQTHGVGKFHFHRRPYGFERQELMEECIDCVTDDDYLMHLRAAGVPTRYPQGLRDLLYYQPQTSGVPEAYSQNRWVADRSCVFLAEHCRYRPERPFFLWSSWIAPHPPFAPVEPYDAMYSPAEMPPPVFADRPIDTLPAPAWPHRGRLDGAHRDPDRMARIKALYYGQVSHVDDAIGQVLDRLQALGLAENTVVVFCSDHGEMLGDHGLSQKNTPYESSVRIPLVVRWPGRTEPGKVRRDPACLTDLLPTLHGVLDIPAAADALLPGRDWFDPASSGGHSGVLPPETRAIDFGHGADRWVALRSPERKYVFWASGGREEAYDLAADPHETRNLIQADEPPAWIEAWRRAAAAWERRYGLGERSFDGEAWRVFPEPPPPNEQTGFISINDGRWAEHLPQDDPFPVESAAQAFDRAIAKENTLAPEKLSVASYLAQGGTLRGTVWGDAE